jgi:hypothetical protein
VIGQRVRRPNGGAPWITVVGIVGAVQRDSLNGAPEPTLYLPVAQEGSGELRVLARGTAGPRSSRRRSAARSPSSTRRCRWGACAPWPG